MLKNNFINDVYTGQMGVQERYHDRSEGATVACTTAPLTAAFQMTGFGLWIFRSKDWKANGHRDQCHGSRFAHAIGVCVLSVAIVVVNCNIPVL